MKSFFIQKSIGKANAKIDKTFEQNICVHFIVLLKVLLSQRRLCTKVHLRMQLQEHKLRFFKFQLNILNPTWNNDGWEPNIVELKLKLETKMKCVNEALNSIQSIQ